MLSDILLSDNGLPRYECATWCMYMYVCACAVCTRCGSVISLAFLEIVTFIIVSYLKRKYIDVAGKYIRGKNLRKIALSYGCCSIFTSPPEDYNNILAILVKKR